MKLENREIKIITALISAEKNRANRTTNRKYVKFLSDLQEKFVMMIDDKCKEVENGEKNI